MDSQLGAPATTHVERIAGRYRVDDVLGRGGMAVVYRVTDIASERQLALKQLVLPQDPALQREAGMLFEREFHTLAQLSHPRVIEVYDYGLDSGNAYYTMELLDGKDLKERSPLPWREACSLLFDVCSSLALLHSRRLVHRDVSPRNIRCTRDGLAKLIDFGALVPMGSGGGIVGTPPFVAPEVVHRLTLDARTDLFSLGATLYFALTGRPAYPARDFSDLAEVWGKKPSPPSSLVQDIPPALDGLVMSLLSLEPALRPRTTFEVMQRLAVLAGIEGIEPSSVSEAYFSTPVLVGRDAALTAVRAQIAEASAGRGGGVLIGGEPGVGRSRMLEACVLEAKTMGATVLRVSASAADGSDFAVAQTLAEQLLETLADEAVSSARESADVFGLLFEQVEPSPSAAAPDAVRPRLRSMLHTSAAPAALAAALSQWLVRLTSRQRVVIAVDDVHKIDEPSAALLAALAHGASRGRLFLALTAETAFGQSASSPLAVLAEHCAPLELQALDAEQTQELLKSVFGDVPNVGLLSARLFEVARGNPRECVDLAQHLVDKGLILYEGGGWTLPTHLDAAALPSSAEQAFCERVAALQPLARWLAETQALASHDAFTRQEYAVLCADREPQQVDQAITELVSRQVLVGDGRVHALSHGNRAASLTAQLDAAGLSQRHRALAELYAQGEDRPLYAVHHLLGAGLDERALDRLVGFLRYLDSKEGLLVDLHMRLEPVAALFERALAVAQKLARPAREIQELRRWLIAISVVADDAVYWRVAPPWLAQLEHDSGLRFWRQLEDVQEPGERLRRAFEQATEQYTSTPEAERVYRPDEAIKQLVYYVVMSIPVGARTLDASLLASLPPLLEPFAPLSPLVEAMWQNAICTFEANCAGLRERARLRAADLFARLEKISETELRYVQTIRHALAYCVGAIEASLGIMSAMSWADLLDRDPLQKVNAMHIRKVVRLQQGDPEGAERFRKRAEVLAVQARARQMFTNMLSIELGAYASAHDLSGVRQVAAAIEPLAARYEGWLPVRHLAEGQFERLRGNPEGALAAYDRCLALCSPDPERPWASIATWPRAIAGRLEVLIELGRFEEAKAQGEHALNVGRERGLAVALHDIARALALAEAKLNDYTSATARLSEVIARQLELGVSGMNLGASYEARARIAIWAGDIAAVEEYACLTAREYRHGRGSPLGALYERLMAEARQAGVRVLPQLSEFESTMMANTMVGHRRSLPAPVNVSQSMRSAENVEHRTARALHMICDARGANAGHLYLVAEGGLALAASSPDTRSEPAAGLLEFVTGYLARELHEFEIATVPEPEPKAEPASKSAIFTDQHGAVYQPLLLTCVIDGNALCAGVAVLLQDGRLEHQAKAAEIVAAVGANLIAAGDTRGVPTRS